MSSRSEWLVARVVNEGYCCVSGYLQICKARGEKVENMAKNIGMSPDTLWYHYRKIKNKDGNAPRCKGFSDCMAGWVEIIEAEKKPGESESSPGKTADHQP